MINKQIKILLIEDNPDDALLIQELLSESDFTSFEIHHEEYITNALECVRKNNYDLVLCDLGLPDCSGFESFSMIHAEAPYIPIVVLTGLNDEEVGFKAIQKGAQDYLVKGHFERNLLIRVIHYAIERKKIEEALRESENRLIEKNREILEFTNVVTHDLKKPLATIKTVNGLLSNENVCTLTEDGREAVAMGKESIDYMQELLKDLLDCAKLEAGTNSIQFENINIRELIDTVLQQLKLLAQQKGIAVARNADGFIYADRKGMTKVFMNLIGNAISYMENKHHPEIIIGISDEINSKEKVFFVKDNGIGIPEDIQKDIFKKFKRGSNANEISGTGLGLFIVKGIVESHGGKIWLESKEGMGTTFYFTLPK